MSQFFESIRVVNNRVMNISYHQDRVNRTCDQMNWRTISIDKIAREHRSKFRKGLYKLRISYSNDEILVNVKSYEILAINRIQVVYDPSISYPLKSEDRVSLDGLFKQNQGADEILIVKNGLITETSIGNIIMYNNNLAFTPKTCLLEGTMRQKLLNENRVILIDIPIEELHLYESVQIINAMRPPSATKRTSTLSISY